MYEYHLLNYEVSLIVAGVGCLDDILLVAISDNLQKIEEELEHRRKQLKNCYAPPLYWVSINQHQF